MTFFKPLQRRFGEVEWDGKSSGKQGAGQNSSLSRQAEGVIAFGVLIEPVFPEFVQASAAVDAAQGQDIFRAGLGPEHARLFAARADDGLATGFDHA